MSDADPAPPAPNLVGLDPRVRTLWWCTAALSVLPLVLVALVVDAFAPVPVPPGSVTVVVLAIAVALALALPALRFRRWRYALRNDDLWIRRGVVWSTTSVIPYARLQFVETHQGPLDRLFGLSRLVVHTAAAGTSGSLPGLDAATAESLRDRLSQVTDDAATV